MHGTHQAPVDVCHPKRGQRRGQASIVAPNALPDRTGGGDLGAQHAIEVGGVRWRQPRQPEEQGGRRVWRNHRCPACAWKPLLTLQGL